MTATPISMILLGSESCCTRAVGGVKHRQRVVCSLAPYEQQQQLYAAIISNMKDGLNSCAEAAVQAIEAVTTRLHRPLTSQCDHGHLG